MKVLVIGVGVIGSYLTHAACAAGNDVTVLARGAWAQTLRENGLVIHHYVQHSTTTDHPRVVESLPEDERFDAAFSVMRQDQQVTALPLLESVNAEVLVLVGNDLRAQELQEHLQAKGHCERVLFGFQSTAGVREGDHAECVRWGATGLDVGPLRGEAGERDRTLLASVFTGKYQPHWTRDMGDWLATHAAAVLPMCFASYSCSCDMRRASNELLHRMVAAQGEAYALLERTGHEILPESDQGLFDGGPRTTIWFLFCWIVAHTKIGTLCIDDHCKHAPDEMAALDASFQKLRAQAPDFPMPEWDRMFENMGGWNEVLDRWGHGVRRTEAENEDASRQNL